MTFAIPCRCVQYPFGCRKKCPHVYGPGFDPSQFVCPGIGCRGRNKAPESDNKFRNRLSPILQSLEEDRKSKMYKYFQSRGEVKKTEEIARFQTGRQMDQRQEDLEKRSDKLRCKIDDETMQWTQEIMDEFKNQKDSKLDVMREKVKKLREQREKEDLKIVEDKLNQAFETSCEQLRTLRVQQMAKLITKDWDEQIKMKQRLECEQEENDRLYDYLWLKDAENKIKREKAYECLRAEALRKGLEELDRQLEYKKEQLGLRAKIDALELEQNAKILEEMENEKKKLAEEKKQRFLKAKDHVKDMMETREYYKNRKLKREEIVALEFLKKAVRELYIEKTDREKAKREMMRAITIYRDYLRDRDCLQNSREEELQKIIDNVIEDQYQKAMETRRQEQRQRRQLFRNVMDGRQRQMDDIKERREEDEKLRRLEVEKLKEDWKLYLRELEMEKEVKAGKQRDYRNDLDCQVQYNQVKQGRSLCEHRREEELNEMQETFFQNKLQKTIYDEKDVRANPFREPLVGKHIKQCLCPV